MHELGHMDLLWMTITKLNLALPIAELAKLGLGRTLAQSLANRIYQTRM